MDKHYYSFITGSHAYGSPSESSDVDLVVAVSLEDYHKLWDLSDSPYKLQFGKLNLVAFKYNDILDSSRYQAWRDTNLLLVNKKPVSKEEACEAFNKAGADLNYFTTIRHES